MAITGDQDKEISAEAREWLRDYLTYQAAELIKNDPKAQAVAKDLVDSLGGSPPAENIQGWLESEPEAVEIAASKVVEQAEQSVGAPAEEQAEFVGKAESVSKEEAELAEISDEIYAELGAALAEDLNDIINRGEPEILKFLADSDNGLCAGVAKLIIEDLKEQNLIGADKEALDEALREPAQQALTEAFDGLCDAIEADGGYIWFLTGGKA